MKAINILLVEDDQLDVIDIKRTLDRMQIIYQLTHAKNGEEAIEILNGNGALGFEELPDLALIDINMPKMNGLELLAMIRNDERLQQLKCFIITTSTENVDRNAAQLLGISGYIAKPLKINSPHNIDTFNLMIDLMNFKSA